MAKRDTLESIARTQTPTGDFAGAVGRLRKAAAAAHERARLLGRPVLAWATARAPRLDPVDLFARGGAITSDRILWQRPEDEISLVGIGAAWVCVAEGPARFLRAEHMWKSIVEQAVGDDHDMGHHRADARGAVSPCPGPVALFGFAFAPDPLPWYGYPAGLVVVPRLVVRRSGGERWLTLAVVVDPDRPSGGSDDLDRFAEQGDDLLRQLARAARPGREPGGTAGASSAGNAPIAEAPISALAGGLRAVEEFPAREAWKASVRTTARAIREGRLRKAVLARGLHLHGDRFDAVAALHRLRSGYPGCTLFAVARRDWCFLGATPERLVRLRHGEVTAVAVAGSAPRGETDEEDRRLGRMLLTSPKDRIEHAIVVEALREALADVCAELVVQDAPGLLTLRNAHHLHTPLRAALREPATVLSLTHRLHPTPAVAGLPREAALAWIHRQEGWDRGWYAGPIGWIDHTGEGEAAVAIRSALVAPTEAFLFAGCGIVADSDPEQEYAESDLKLQPVLSALGGAGPARQPKGQA